MLSVMAFLEGMVHEELSKYVLDVKGEPSLLLLAIPVVIK
jgi:hypothetical protein